jgi:hypothetical protein
VNINRFIEIGKFWKDTYSPFYPCLMKPCSYGSRRVLSEFITSRLRSCTFF